MAAYPRRARCRAVETAQVPPPAMTMRDEVVSLVAMLHSRRGREMDGMGWDGLGWVALPLPVFTPSADARERGSSTLYLHLCIWTERLKAYHMSTDSLF